MDFVIERNGVFYRWNLEKATQNYKKHGVRFEVAIEVFDDELLIYEDASDGEEIRAAAIGETLSHDVLYVVHLERFDDSVRIISARPLTRREQKIYENEA